MDLSAYKHDPQRGRVLDAKRYRAGSHASDAGRYKWLCDRLKQAGQLDAAERAEQWAKEHQRVAFDLLGLKGRQP